MSKGKDALIAMTLAHAMTLGMRGEYGYQKPLHFHTGEMNMRRIEKAHRKNKQKGKK